ncbi:MAG: carbohydrate ABC transporter substrate-binding protein [Actinobacteria bacterium]|nr:carbohydrate ABC transporter substrate-binding protein [Actinomycetota bacterium]
MRVAKFRRVALALAATGLLASGCLQGGDDDESSNGDSGGGTAGAGGSEPGDGEVTVSGVFTGDEQAAFEESLAAFEDESGIDVAYDGNADFTTLINSRVQANPPDIGLFPQPGLLLDLAARDTIVPIDEFLDVDTLNETLIDGFLDSVTDDEDTIFGAPMKMAVKSVVFVPKQAWADGGYPLEFASVQELQETAQEIAGEGIAPWCIGYESGPATGWVGTDWLEEFVLRVAGPEVYDQWVSHEIPFNDPQIAEALDAYAELLGDDAENVLGGRSGILNQPFGEAGNPSFETPPACMMQRQGDFITTTFPADVQKNLDQSVSVFTFPPYEGGYDGQPILGGGDMAALFNGEDDEAKEVMEFLTSDEFGAEWAQAGGWLSPHTTFDVSNYPDDTRRTVAELASRSDVFRYDASDLMPAEVGAGTFWEGSVEWIQGDVTTDEMLTSIEESWPE